MKRINNALYTAVLQLLLAGVMVGWTIPAHASDEGGTDRKWIGGVGWQRNGDWIIFERDADTPNTSIIYKIRSDGTGLTQLSINGDETNPVWSRDGTRIAFGTRTSSETIWTMDANGGNRISLGEHTNLGAICCWSPDGQKIAYLKQGEGIILIINMAGEEVAIGGGGTSADWHPGGRYMVVDRESNVPGHTYGVNLYESDLESDDYRQITTGDYLDMDPRYSPDGEWIVFVSGMRARDMGGGSSICLVRRDGSELSVLPLGDPEGWVHSSPDFSPDGQYIVFARGPEAASDLYICSRDGTELRRLTYFYPQIGKAKRPIRMAKASSKQKTAAAPRHTEKGAITAQTTPRTAKKNAIPTVKSKAQAKVGLGLVLAFDLIALSLG
jgi:Tol biopolymer transport system component